MSDRCPDNAGDLLPIPQKKVVEQERCAASKIAPVVIARRAALIYEPRLRQVGPRLEIRGKRNDPGLIPWGFWGGLLLVSVVLLFVFGVGFTRLRNLGELLLTLGLISAGGVMLRLGRRTSLREGLICEVDGPSREIRWPTLSRGSEVVLPLEEVDSLEYGILRFVDEDHGSDEGVEAYGLHVRERSGKLRPLIEASVDAHETHQVGLKVAATLGVRMVYGGEGMKE